MKHALVLMAAVLPLCAQVKVTQHGNQKISVEIDGKPYSEFFIGPETHKPYLAPLRSASGTIVTRAYPMESSVPGEAHDHPHHRGLWFTHGAVNGYDFWANESDQKGVGNGKGEVSLKKVNEVSSGKTGSIDATFEWKAGGKTLLTESRKMTFAGDAQLRTIDFDITLAPEEKVVFGDTKEGMFAIRLAAPLEEVQPRNITEPKRNGKLSNAQGKVGEKLVWGKRSEWADYSGQIDGKPVGVAIFDHPGNPRHPTYWHSRSYGLFATNIFGVHDFENDKQKDGSMTIEKGQPLRFRFRVVVHPGLEAGKIGELFKSYAAGN